MIFDSCGLLDQRCHPPDGPQRGGVAVGLRTFNQGRFNLRFLLPGEAWQSASASGFAEGLFAFFL